MPLIFTAPWLLAGLATLPVIWWLLRAIPPKPAQEPFPPLAILARLIRHDQQASKSPWWLTLLRLLIAALIIFAVSGPVWKPLPVGFTGSQPVAIMLDNGWASAPRWDAFQNQVQWLINNAEKNDAPVFLIATADAEAGESGPFNAAQAAERLQALKPHPVPVDRAIAAKRLQTALNGKPQSRIFYLTDGLATPQDKTAFATLDKIAASSLQLIMPEDAQLYAITGAANHPDALKVQLLRPQQNNTAQNLHITAYDNQGRVLAGTGADFAQGAATANAELKIPVELRNDTAMLRIDNSAQAAATWLLDENNRRRRVGLLNAGNADKAHSLLSPLHYISSAMAPFADLISANEQDLAQSVDRLLQQKPSIIVLSDIGRLPENAAAKLSRWVENGGTLLRFAGPRLAAAQTNEQTAKRDPLLPVQLRGGQRNLGGTLSWSTPQHIAPAPQNSPFHGIALADDITVLKQVLAEPSADLMQKSWLNLTDGTPLITGENRGSGRVILFHIAPDVGWSNLPLSGSFVDLLHRITELSATQAGDNGIEQAASLPAYRLLDAAGNLGSQPRAAKPLVVEKGKTPLVSALTPPGLYGTEQAYKALNLMNSNSTMAPLAKPVMATTVSMVAATKAQSINLQGWLFALAALLLALDGFMILWISGVFSRNSIRNFSRRNSGALKSLLLLFALSPLFAAAPFALPPAQAAETASPKDDSKPGDGEKIAVLDVTHLAYVITGDKTIDETSRMGLSGLSQFIADKTALEPGAPIGVNPEKDELAFYPMIYWPVDAKAPFPSEKALQRIDAYMQQGGTVLFDTRDQLTGNTGGTGGTSPATQRLRDMLDMMNIPPLSPVADNHVLSKTFYLMPDFPGRYRGSPLWGEAQPDNNTANRNNDPAGRPVSNGDGVSPILITANDLAGAWAMDENWQPLYPTVPNDPRQRIYALRGGVNIVMYVLTGNYKADQVHVPALLERLGN